MLTNQNNGSNKTPDTIPYNIQEKNSNLINISTFIQKLQLLNKAQAKLNLNKAVPAAVNRTTSEDAKSSRSQLLQRNMNVNTSLPNFKSDFQQHRGKGKHLFSPNTKSKPFSPNNINTMSNLQGKTSGRQ